MWNMNANATYELSYYISVRSGRVPHDGTLTINSGTTGIDYYITNPFPIRIYTKSPNTPSTSTSLVDSAIRIGQDIIFGRGTDTDNVIVTSGTTSVKKYLTTTYIHGTNAAATSWNGSWKKMKFQFSFKDLKTVGDINVDTNGVYVNNQAYIKFGPLPITRGSGSSRVAEFMNSCINISGISIKNIT
jgi:hypothetical protein